MKNKIILPLVALLSLFVCNLPAMSAVAQDDECGVTYVLKQRTPEDPKFLDLPASKNHPLQQHNNRYLYYSDEKYWTYVSYLDLREGLIEPERTRQNYERFKQSIRALGQKLIAFQPVNEPSPKLEKSWENLLKTLHQNPSMDHLASIYVGMRFLHVELQQAADQFYPALPEQIERLAKNEEIYNFYTDKTRQEHLKSQRRQQEKAAWDKMINELKNFFK